MKNLLHRLLITEYRIRVSAPRMLGLITVYCLFCCSTLFAITNYVGQAGTPGGNYFTDIQSAVDASSAGDLVLVSNGVYNTGERVTPGYVLSNRVVILENITVRSVNGPVGAIILGGEAPGGGTGTGAVRCVFMTAGTLSGFTISNGHTSTSGSYFRDRSGGGVWSTNGCVVTNCIVSGNVSDYDAGGVLCLYGGLVRNCKIDGNKAYIGGGIFCYYGGEIDNCTFTGNSAGYGGGVQCNKGGEVNNCTFIGNAAEYGGGARCYQGGEYNNCIIYSNTAEAGGGVHCYQGGLMNNSTINNNNAEAGGGIYCYKGGIINNSSVAMNNALFGGGVYCNEDGILINCTISDIDAFAGGGVFCDEGGSLTNTIIHSNTAQEYNNWANYDIGMSYANCCTTPDPGGTGNITNNPVLVNFAHIAMNSPCIGLGDSSAATGVDIDGDAWLSPPAIGCDQPTLAGLTGALSVVVHAEMTNLTAGTQCRLNGYVEGMAETISWSFGEGATETNLSYATSHAWNTPGEYPVILTALNSDNPAGVAGTVTVYIVSESTHYVVRDNSAPVWPYNSWTTNSI